MDGPPAPDGTPDTRSDLLIMERRLWHILAGTDGGRNRAKIIRALHRSPDNANQLAERLALNYNTVRYHLDVLEGHEIVESTDDDYGQEYDLTAQLYRHWETFERIADDIE